MPGSKQSLDTFSGNKAEHMVCISTVEKYEGSACRTQDSITNTDTWQGLAGEDRIFLCLPDNMTGVQPTGEQFIWWWPVAPWQNVLVGTSMSAWEACLPPPPRQATLQWDRPRPAAAKDAFTPLAQFGFRSLGKNTREEVLASLFNFPILELKKSHL